MGRRPDYLRRRPPRPRFLPRQSEHAPVNDGLRTHHRRSRTSRVCLLRGARDQG